MSQTNELEIMERIALDLESVSKSLLHHLFNTGARGLQCTDSTKLSAAGGKRLRAQLLAYC